MVNNARLQGVVSSGSVTATSITGVDADTLSMLNGILREFMPSLVRRLINGNGLVLFYVSRVELK